jgi:F-type H+-transporting ATPase subunit epsilon
MTLKVELVSPERILYEGDADMVIARTIGGGDIAFLTGHTPFLAALEIHPVIVRPPDGDDLAIAVHGGFVSVSGDRVTILSDIAELQSQIDVERAKRAHEAALAATKADADDLAAVSALARAECRLRAVGALDGVGH